MVYTLPLFGLMLPFFCWAIESIFPYPYLIEELGKAILVVLAWQFPRKSSQVKAIILTGIFFAFSESVFYLFKLSFDGNLTIFLLRLLLTTFLHVITFLVILLPTLKNKKLLFLGLLLAVIIHYLYNFFVSSL